MKRSRRIVILWQPEYFTRLWCVYEVAAFAFLNPGKHDMLTLLPLKMPLFTLVIFFFHFAASVSLTVLSPLLLFSDWHTTWIVDNIPRDGQYLYLVLAIMIIMFFGLYLIPSYFLWKFCKAHQEDRRRLLAQLRGFCMRQTQCAVEADRELVVGKIERWFGSTEEFERYVREDLYSIVQFQLQRHGPMRYRMACVGSIPHLFICITLAVGAAEDGEWQLFRHLALGTPLVCLCTDAIALRLSLLLAGRRLGRGDRFMGPILVALCFAIVNALSVAVWTPALPLWVAATIAATFGITTFLLYGGMSRTRYVHQEVISRLSTSRTSRSSFSSCKASVESRLEKSSVTSSGRQSPDNSPQSFSNREDSFESCN